MVKKNKIISVLKGNLRCGKEVMYREIAVIYYLWNNKEKITTEIFKEEFK